jgi:hypothetical protein
MSHHRWHGGLAFIHAYTLVLGRPSEHGKQHLLRAAAGGIRQDCPERQFLDPGRQIADPDRSEYTFTFENTNIERGLLWIQEPAISRCGRLAVPERARHAGERGQMIVARLVAIMVFTYRAAVQQRHIERRALALHPTNVKRGSVFSMTRESTE